TGAAVVMNFGSGKRWLDMVQLGAEVVIFLEPEDGKIITSDEAIAKVTNTPLSVPRFYLRRDGLPSLFPGQTEAQAMITRPQVTISGTPGRWVRKDVYAEWLLIPGAKDAVGGNFREDPGQQLVHVVAYKDASSVIPDLSPGAQSAANLVSVLR